MSEPAVRVDGLLKVFDVPERDEGLKAATSVRATVISMTNLGDSAGEWGGGPALGLVGNAFGIRAALAAGAAALTPALLLYGLALRRGDRTTSFDIVPQPES